ncbi:MAG: zinc ribbon domain-containing protein [Gammaproteobacteria bacterium]|nr:zinc ribbon domain-containing protein [Gammaproteobacteria bacterium]
MRRVKVLDRPRVEHTDERLRIVSDRLWELVKARQARTAHAQSATTVRGTPRRGGGGKPGKYLFTGLLACDLCGASFVLRNREYYACASHWHGGACSNTINVARAVVQDVMLVGISEDLADPAVVDEVERRFGVAMRREKKPADNRPRIAQLEREIENITNAIARGLVSDALAQRLRAAEADLRALRQAPQRAAPTLLLPDVRARFLEMGKALDQILMRDPERGREELRGILGDKIRMRPDLSGRFLWADYSLGLVALLPKQGNADTVVAGAGFEPATFGL